MHHQMARGMLSLHRPCQACLGLRGLESNQRQSDYEPGALPTELPRNSLSHLAHVRRQSVLRMWVKVWTQFVRCDLPTDSLRETQHSFCRTLTKNNLTDHGLSAAQSFSKLFLRHPRCFQIFIQAHVIHITTASCF